MCDRRGKPPQRGHALLRDDLAFQALQLGEVLKVEDIAARLILAVRNGETERPSNEWPRQESEIRFLSAARAGFPARPASTGQNPGSTFSTFSPRSSPNPSPAISAPARFISRIRPFKIRGEQAATHGLDDVLIECLQIFQFLAFFLPAPLPSCEASERASFQDKLRRRTRTDCSPARNPESEQPASNSRCGRSRRSNISSITHRAEGQNSCPRRGKRRAAKTARWSLKSPADRGT